MTPTQRKAMGQAIDALDEAANVLTSSMFAEAAESLRNALAEPAPAWPSEDQVWAALQAYNKSESNAAGMLEALIAGSEQPRKAEPAPEPVAHLWQHGETGRTRVVMPDSVTDCDARWQLIGPLYLAASAREPAPVPLLTDDEIGRIFLKFEGSLQSLRNCASEIEKLYRQKAGL